MNIYLVVEGSSVEKTVYPEWIKLLKPELQQVNDLHQIKENNFYLVSGNGYPNYLQVIEDAIADVNSEPAFDRLVISVDSEDMTYAEKHTEIAEHVQKCSPKKDTRIIVQDCCFETWCLGNLRNYTRAPQNSDLRDYQTFYDVSQFDPELMDSMKPNVFNKAQFHNRYLSLLCQEKGQFYTKSNPRYVAHEKFFFHVMRRHNTTNHLRSVADFISAFN